MDDLISRKAAIEAAKIPNGEYPNPSERHGIIIARVEARRRIREIPSVPAVPLDKLCDALSKHLGNPPCPCGYDLKGTSCNPDWTKKECWYYCLTNWMEAQDAR